MRAPYTLFDGVKKVASGQAMRGWVRPKIGRVFLQAFSRSSPDARALFNEDYLRRLVAWHEEGRADLTQHLIVLLVFLPWHRRWLEGRALTLDEIAAMSRRPPDVSGTSTALSSKDVKPWT